MNKLTRKSVNPQLRALTKRLEGWCGMRIAVIERASLSIDELHDYQTLRRVNMEIVYLERPRRITKPKGKD